MKLDDSIFTEAVFLHALLVPEADALSARPTEVAPSESFYWLMTELLEQRVLIAAERPLMKAAPFTFPAGTLPQPRYTLPRGLFPDHRHARHALGDFLKASRRLPTVREQQVALWTSLAMAELHGYMEWELAIHHFDTAWSDELFTAFDFGLGHFSISQMFYFCWTGVRDLASHHLRNPAPADTYRDYLAQALTNKLKRALREGWQVRQYTRQWRRPTSAVVETFTNVASDLGDRFLLLVPSRSALESLF